LKNLPGSTETIATFKLVPVTGSVGSVLQVKVGTALSETEFDADLDPKLQLVEASWASKSHQMRGTEQDLIVKHLEPVLVSIRVKRSESTTVLFDISAEELEG
jgi:hypothetical protein